MHACECECACASCAFYVQHKQTILSRSHIKYGPFLLYIYPFGVIEGKLVCSIQNPDCVLFFYFFMSLATHPLCI